MDMYEEVCGRQPKMDICIHASVCQDLLLHTGAGRVKHLSATQSWVKGAVQAPHWEIRARMPWFAW